MLPSERCTDLEIEELFVIPEEIPKCHCCNEAMKGKSLVYLIPQKYYIVRSKRPKFN
jgi:hypothetical protein